MSDTSTPETTAKKARHPALDRRKRTRRIFTIVVVIALLLVGGALGRLLLPRESHQVVVDRGEVVAASDAEMPDVVGIDREVAGFVLSDAGVSVPVEVSARPAAGQLGRVLEQEPAPGQPAGDGIRLVVSEEWVMPDFAGSTIREARAEMDRHGAVVTERSELDLGQPAGHVVRTNPSAGETAAQVIEVVIAEEGQWISLLDTRTEQSGRWSSNSNVSVAGKKQDKAFSGRNSRDDVSGWWVLGRNAASLKTTIGLSDASDPDAGGRITFLADGEVVGEFDVRYSESQEIEIPLHGVFRLEVVGAAGEDAVLVIGDPLLRVSAEGAQELTS